MMRGNPFRAMNRVQNLMDMANQAKQFQKNPSKIGKVLFDNGRISQEQYDAIKDMNSPSQIGNYLMNNGVLNQQQLTHMSQFVPQVQQAMNQ